MAYLERRFRSRKLGVPFARPCRRDEAGNEYGKSTLCRWQQATPSTGAWTSILHSGAQNSSTLPGWPCAMSHRGQAAGCCLWGRFWRCLVPRKSAPLTKWTSHGVCHPRLSGSSADNVVQRSKPDERMNGGRGWEWRQWCISTGATLANWLDPIASLTFFVSFKAACNILRDWLVYFAVPFWIIQKLMYESCVLFTEACVCLKGNIEEHQLVCIESGAFTSVCWIYYLYNQDI